MHTLSKQVLVATPSSKTFSLTRKGLNLKSAEGRLVERVMTAFLSQLDFNWESYTMWVGRLVTPAHISQPHLKLITHSDTGVALKIRCDTTSESTYLVVLNCNGVKPYDLFRSIKRKIHDGGNILMLEHGDKHKPATVVPFPSQSMPVLAEVAVGAVSPATTSESPESAPAPAEVSVPGSHALLGFTKSEENVALMLMEIKQKHGGDKITNDRFHQLMRQAQYCGADDTNHAIGQIMGKFIRMGYLIKCKIHSINYYHLSPKAFELISKNEKAGEKTASEPIVAPVVVSVPVIPPVLPQEFDLNLLQQRLVVIGSQVAELKAARAKQEEVSRFIQGTENELADLHVQMEYLKVAEGEIVSRRDFLFDEVVKLQSIISDPALIEAEKTLATFAGLMRM